MSRDSAGKPAGFRKFNVEELLEPHHPRTNFYVAYVDGTYAIRVAKIRDTFPKHFHPNGDEAWFVYRGRLRIDSDWGPVELKSGEGTVIPKGIRHSPTCLESGTLVLVMHIKEFQTIPVNETEFAASGYTEIDVSLTDGGEAQ